MYDKDVIIHKSWAITGEHMAEALVIIGGQNGVELPALFAPDARTAERVIEFFTACIRNPNTRKAYARATGTFAAWCVEQGIGELGPDTARACRGLCGGVAAKKRSPLGQVAPRSAPHAL